MGLFQYRRDQTAAGGCSIGLSSPHSYGEAFYSVTCSQRKYLSRMRVSATVLPGAADGIVFLAPFHSEISSRTHHPAQRIRNVSVRLIHLSPCITNWKSNMENKRQNKLKLCIKSLIASDFGKRKTLHILLQV